MVVSNRNLLFQGAPIFRGELLVSGRVSPVDLELARSTHAPTPTMQPEPPSCTATGFFTADFVGLRLQRIRVRNMGDLQILEDGLRSDTGEAVSTWIPSPPKKNSQVLQVGEVVDIWDWFQLLLS